MVSDEQVLARARAAWQDAMPTDAEVNRGAQRVGRTLRAHRRASSARTVWTLAGSVAAFMATLAYAGMGHHRESEEAIAIVSTGEASGVSSGAEQRGPLGAQRRASAGPRERATAASAALAPVPSETPGASTPGLAGDVAELATGVASPSAADEAPAPPSSAAPSVHSRGKGRALLVRGDDDPSWRAVSDALAAGKQWRAEQLLTRLAERGGDANTRAKAKLGLGQLEASRGRCAKARQLALAVAGQNGIEMKTVRRALELAARCLR